MKQNNNFWKQASEYTSLAFLLPASTFVGYVIGHLLDKALGTRFLYIVFLLLGIAAGFIKLLQQIQKDTSDGGK